MPCNDTIWRLCVTVCQHSIACKRTSDRSWLEATARQNPREYDPKSHNYPETLADNLLSVVIPKKVNLLESYLGEHN